MTGVHVPLQLWLYAVLGVLATPPASYVVRYLTHSPSRRDGKRRISDVAWRTRRRLALCMAMLVAIAAIVAFSLTPVGWRVVHWRFFVPAILLLAGAASAVTTVRGIVAESVTPMIRGSFRPRTRRRQPVRYWLLIGWNFLLSAVMLALAPTLAFAPQPQAFSQTNLARCFDVRLSFDAAQERKACDRLIDDRGSMPGLDLADLYTARGAAAGRQGDLQSAIDDFTEALRIKPAYPEVLDNRAMAFIRTGQWESAVADLSSAIRLKPDFAQAYFNRALCFEHLGDDRRALADLDQAVRLEPNAVDALVKRALVHRRLGQDAEADSDMAAAARLDPKILKRARAQAVEKSQ